MARSGEAGSAITEPSTETDTDTVIVRYLDTKRKRLLELIRAHLPDADDAEHEPTSS